MARSGPGPYRSPPLPLVAACDQKVSGVIIGVRAATERYLPVSMPPDSVDLGDTLTLLATALDDTDVDLVTDIAALTAAAYDAVPS